MKRKSLYFLVLVGLLLGSLVACGGVESPVDGQKGTKVSSLLKEPACYAPRCYTCTACETTETCDWSCTTPYKCTVQVESCTEVTPCRGGQVFDRRWCKCVDTSYCGEGNLCETGEFCCNVNGAGMGTCESGGCSAPTIGYVCVNGKPVEL